MSPVCFCAVCRGPIRLPLPQAGGVIECPECGTEILPRKPSPQRPTGVERSWLEVRSIAWQWSGSGARRLTGSVINRSGKNLKWVRIEFLLYDTTGFPIAGASDSLIYLPSGQEWRFGVAVFQPEVVSASAPVIACDLGRLEARTGHIFTASPEASPPAGQ